MSVVSGTAAVARVRVALERVVDPCSIATGAPISLPEMGLIRSVRDAGDGRIVVEMRLTSPFCFQIGLMLERIQQVTQDLQGVREVTVEVDHGDEWLPQMMSSTAQARLQRIRPAEAVPARTPSGDADSASRQRS